MKEFVCVCVVLVSKTIPDNPLQNRANPDLLHLRGTEAVQICLFQWFTVSRCCSSLCTTSNSDFSYDLDWCECIYCHIVHAWSVHERKWGKETIWTFWNEVFAPVSNCFSTMQAKWLWMFLFVPSIFNELQKIQLLSIYILSTCIFCFVFFIWS